MISRLSPEFLRMGGDSSQSECLGTEPELKEELMTSVMSEEIPERQFLPRLDGMGSRTQVASSQYVLKSPLSGSLYGKITSDGSLRFNESKLMGPENDKV